MHQYLGAVYDAWYVSYRRYMGVYQACKLLLLRGQEPNETSPTEAEYRCQVNTIRTWYEHV